MGGFVVCDFHFPGSHRKNEQCIPRRRIDGGKFHKPQLHAKWTVVRWCRCASTWPKSESLKSGPGQSVVQVHSDGAKCLARPAGRWCRCASTWLCPENQSLPEVLSLANRVVQLDPANLVAHNFLKLSMILEFPSRLAHKLACHP